VFVICVCARVFGVSALIVCECFRSDLNLRTVSASAPVSFLLRSETSPVLTGTTLTATSIPHQQCDRITLGLVLV